MAFEFKNSKGVELLPAFQRSDPQGRPQAEDLLLRPRHPSRRAGRGSRRVQGHRDHEDRDAHSQEKITSLRIARTRAGSRPPARAVISLEGFLRFRVYSGHDPSRSTGRCFSALLSGLFAAACADNAGPRPPAAAGPPTIAVIPKGMTHEFWKSIHAGAAQAARGAGRRDPVEGAAEGRRPGPADHRRRGRHQPRRGRHRPRPAGRPGPRPPRPGRHARRRSPS